MPLMFLPIVLSTSADALVGLNRISTFLRAEELEEPYTIQNETKYAVDMDGDFAWETAMKSEAKSGGKGGKKSKAKAKKEAKGGKDKDVATSLPSSTDDLSEKDSQKEAPQDAPFALLDLKMAVPRGAFVAIIGTVGSGKVHCL
jgi:hypothetical protein